MTTKQSTWKLGDHIDTSKIRTPQQLAAQLDAALIVKTRNNGETFYSLKDDAPAWMTDAVRACHDAGSELPNDWRYQFIKDAAITLSDTSEWDDLDYPESDLYNHKLFKWLAEFPNADWYCDEVLDAGLTLPGDDLMSRISSGQAYAKNETQERLKSFLEALAENDQAAEVA